MSSDENERYYCEFDPCILDHIERSLKGLVHRVQTKTIRDKEEAMNATFKEVQYIIAIYRAYAVALNRVSSFANYSPCQRQLVERLYPIR